MRRIEVRPASGKQEAVDVVEQASSGATVGNERQDDRHAAEFFDGSYVAGPEEVGGLSSAHIFAVTGIKVRCYPDDRLHVIESVPMAEEPVRARKSQRHGPAQPGHRGSAPAYRP